MLRLHLNVCHVGLMSDVRYPSSMLFKNKEFWGESANSRRDDFQFVLNLSNLHYCMIFYKV